MEIVCERNCQERFKKACTLEMLHIDDKGMCTGFIPKNNVYREDNVVLYDDAGIPSIMVRLDRPEDGSEDSVFTIGSELYDEIYISKYKNCEINGLPYSLPHQKPWTNIKWEDAEQACFKKGEGWHMLTVPEHGMLARLSLKTDTLPHGNTNCGKYHADATEKCEMFNGRQMYTGSGPETWYHDHTIFGVDGLCGDTWEMMRGLRLLNGQVQVAKNNDAALPIDLSANGDAWEKVKTKDGYLHVGVRDGEVCFTDSTRVSGWTGSRWEDVEFRTEMPEQLIALGFMAGDPKNAIYVDADGERVPHCGGFWSVGGFAGVFSVHLDYGRGSAYHYIGFRSAYFRKTGKLRTE